MAKPAQVASRTPPTETSADGTIQISFNSGSSDLPSTASGALDQLVARMKSSADIRVQLHGFASGTSDSPSQARRMSLFRALSVRTYLMKKGIRSTRIDVRALGKKDDGEPVDRVDVIIPTS
jgi:outer membrane protein OmpA-like peptidoglycan-associated protein